jgi:hypothetical protein
VADRYSLPPEYREAEKVLTRLRGVVAAHIVADAQGEIAEVHVIATDERNVRQILRDVEAALAAQLGIKIDHRKISIAQVGKAAGTGEDAAPAPAPPPQTGPDRLRILSPEREAGHGTRPAVDLKSPGGISEVGVATDTQPRLRFIGMNLQVSGDGCTARVELSHGTIRTMGDSEGPGAGRAALRSLAVATLGAVMHHFQDSAAFHLEDIAFTTLGEDEIVIVSVSYRRGREVIPLLGSTYVGTDPQQAVIFATLDAINRFSGRLKERGFVEYEVGPSPV